MFDFLKINRMKEATDNYRRETWVRNYVKTETEITVILQQETGVSGGAQ